MSYEEQYLALLKELIGKGDLVEDRTGTGTYSLFGRTLEQDLSKGFPLLTTKKVNFNLVAGELLWFLSGDVDLGSLRRYQNKPEGSHTIWSDDFNKYKETSLLNPTNECLGRIYGNQLRSYNCVDIDYYNHYHDQLTTLIDNIKAVKENPSHPMSRRLRCVFWNPYDHTIGDKKWCALPACHTDFQCIVRKGKLHLSFSMRSSDTFLGLPFNMASYALLCHILAKLTGLEVGVVKYYGVDVHLYSNHKEQALEQLSRQPTELPEIVMPEFETLEQLLELTGKDFKLKGYNPQGFIKAPQAS